MNTSEFISKAIEMHGDKYDYSESVYVNKKEKIKIICPKHGVFYQNYYGHLHGKGCPLCANERKKIQFTDTLETFIEKAKKVHGDKYDYSKVNYINSAEKICIICPIHGEFWQTPNSHLQGSGCPKCATISAHDKQKKPQSDIITQCLKRHNNFYSYDKAIYINGKTKFTVTCPIHGDFQVTPLKHLYRGDGCPKCRYIKSSSSNTLTNEEFISKAKEIHGNKYDYSKVKYINYDTPICIICPIHGEFWQTPDSHLQGSGCPKCSNVLSKNENEIFEYLCNLIGKDKVIQRDRTILNGQELDIYIPSKNIAFEYNGLRWHSELFGKNKNYHLDKTQKCLDKNINLIQIFEDEYVQHKNIVLSKICHLLHTDNTMPHIMGRKCIIHEITNDEAQKFLEENHIQGYAKASIYLGAFFNNDLIAVMSFLKNNKTDYELNRFASKIDVICQGVGGKLFNYFIKHYDFHIIKSFADRRWTCTYTNNIYTKLGFSLEKILPPSYTYYDGHNLFKRYHKFNFRKNILHKKYGLPLTMTETEMCNEIKAYKVWDCGLLKYVYYN